MSQAVSTSGSLLSVIVNPGSGSPAECGVTYIESLDLANPAVLRELDSGSYVLYGKFKAYSGDDTIIVFESKLNANIVKSTDCSSIMIFNPVNSKVECLTIYDDRYERTDVALQDVVAHIGQLKDDIAQLETDVYGRYIVKSSYTSEYLSGPKKYGIWIPLTIEDASITLRCNDVSDGTYTFQCGNVDKVLTGKTITATFSNGISVFDSTGLSPNDKYVRLITDNINPDSIAEIVEKENGMHEKLNIVKDLIDAVSESHDSLEKIVNGVNEFTEIAKSEYVTGPNCYAFFLPIVRLSKFTIYCEKISDGKLTAQYAYIDTKYVTGKSKELDFNTGYAYVDASDAPFENCYLRIIPSEKNVVDGDILYSVNHGDGLVDTVSKHSNEIEETKNDIQQLEYKTEYDNLQIRKVCDDSTIKCAPYLFESVGWHTYNPRFNILSFPDFNEEVNLLTKTSKWFDDKLIDDSFAFIVSQGDSVASTKKTKTEWSAMASKVVDAVNAIEKPFVFCVGNHDTGEDGIYEIAESERVTRSIRYNNWFLPLLNRLKETNGESTVHVNTSHAESMYYYVDIDWKGYKARVFAMDESEYPIVYDSNGYLKYSMCVCYYLNNVIQRGFNSYYSENQLRFLVDALSSCENDRTFILINHENIEYDDSNHTGSLCGCKEAMESIVDAFRKNTSITVNVDSIENVGAYSITADFSANSGQHPYIHMVGHNHNFELYRKTDGYVLRTTCGGTPSTQIKAKNSIMQYGVDIVSIASDYSAYFLRFGYAPNRRYSNADRDGFNNINNPISLLE